MAEIFATNFPQNINCNLIYDKAHSYYRPTINSDYVGGAAGTDAFGRQRVSTPETIFSSKQLFDNQPLYWDDIEYSGSGTNSVYSSNRASTTLSVSNITAGKRIRQTRRRFNYQPSKSQLIFITSVLKKSGGGTGIVIRNGYFDENNGLFLQLSGNTISLIRRSNVTGTPVDEVVSRSSWNIDKMDGNGISQVDLDFTKAQILVIDFEWLGVGRVRIGFNVDGINYYCHEFLHANNINSVYMSTPNLPIRYEIENNGSGVASSTECICSAVTSEGGDEIRAKNTYLSTDGTSVSCTNGFTNGVLAFRLKEDHIGCTIDLLDSSLLIGSNDNYEWSVIYNPSGIDNLSYISLENSAVEYCIFPNETHLSGGYKIFGGYAEAKTAVSSDTSRGIIKLGSSITGARDVMAICCFPLGASAANLYAGVTFREFE